MQSAQVRCPVSCHQRAINLGKEGVLTVTHGPAAPQVRAGLSGSPTESQFGQGYALLSHVMGPLPPAVFYRDFYQDGP